MKGISKIENNIGAGLSKWARIRPVLAILLLSLCMGICGCGVDDIDISGCADETISIEGIADSPITVSVQDLKDMECVTKKTESTSDKIGKVRATGPTLDTVLRQFGMSQDQVNTVKIYAKDKYDVKFDKEVLEKNDIILAFGIDGQPLGEEDAPVRVIIPKSDSAYWIRMVERIEIVD